MSIETCKLILDTDQHELQVQGTPMFPCACYFSDISDNVTGDIPWHWHEEIEVVVVSSGAMNMSLNGVNFTLKKGEGALINSNVLHSMQIVGEAGCILNSFVFHPSLISGAAESVFEQRYVRPILGCDTLPGIPFHCGIEWQHQAVHCIQEAYKAYSKEEFGYELIVREKLSHMWYLIVKNMVSVLKNQNYNENHNIIRIKAMLDFLHHHYEEPLELQQIAAVVNISERECLRCFQKNIRITPIQYLLKYRISVAARLLENTDISITEICNRVGFDNPSYFSKIFKRFMRFTPSDYRKQQKKS
ncbi:AraC family transcriptional regulator [Clostridium botulinum A2 117]|uniref:AraC family transcriptional regulator n=1 Tax=Clostridium botulinum TaxID=1491 RepID=UPI0007E235FD|nr:AraC family transcriptional regulator [Clostridium botulinum]KEI77785.1 AraC family transcriptional regulator [Clostridium botulinum A2 117]MBN3414957.1 AraC family transcriptional regulator [Clostridium botulinum]MBN3441250.1 AraC family transcriptional regulator [Clostridium botulinum]MBY6805319.1 helix-turn-helix transcriptional regulator [Clostridium botulinum]MCS4472772.1 AraC family transcriptional regulator [Clostridium botulinum]